LHKYAAVPNLESAEEGARALERAIFERGADTLAAFVVEPITGSSGAAVELPPGYLPAVREICDRYELLLVADEIVTAFGRTGRAFAVEHLGAVPDLITFGKGVGGGLVPLSGMVASRRLREVVERSPSGFSYGHTFSGYPLGCAVGCAVLEVIERESLIEAAAAKGERLRARLDQVAGEHALVHEVRGRGLLQGIELRRPDGTRFAAAEGVYALLVEETRERGVLVYGCPTPVADEHMDAVLLAPPLVISDGELELVCEALDAALAAVSRRLGLPA
jgi:putrescine aminotransferase